MLMIIVLFNFVFLVSTELGGCAEVRRCNQKCSHVLQKSYEIAKKSGAYMPFDVTSVSSNTKY